MLIKIENTTDHKYIGCHVEYDGKVDELYLCGDVKIELIKVEIENNTIKLISSNYIVDAIIIEE
jgi:hypothetical protein